MEYISVLKGFICLPSFAVFTLFPITWREQILWNQKDNIYYNIDEELINLNPVRYTLIKSEHPVEHSMLGVSAWSIMWSIKRTRHPLIIMNLANSFMFLKHYET